MFKQVVLFLSLIQLMHGLSLRSNIWWSRRSESSLPDCDVAFDNENPSLEAKICAQIKESLNASLEDCQEKCEQCEKRCLTDKRTSRIAAENWAKVVAVLRQFNSYWPVKEEQTQSTEP
ncbi:unnamed protein product [Rotaria socialis]